MFELVKKLFSTQDGTHTVIIMNDDGTKPSSSHRLQPFYLWLFFLSVLAVTVIIVVCSFLFTPLGSFVYNQGNVRESVIAIQQKVVGLQDTLQARNAQLQQIKQILVTGDDSTMASLPPAAAFKKPGSSDDALTSSLRVPENALVTSNLFGRTPNIEGNYPVDGTTTRRFNYSNGHLGVDIAAESGLPFRVIADGVIVSQGWTLNYGYVIIVQHGEGILSVYKHAAEVAHAVGESILKGTILGTIGDVGILSSGPHLHFEIWDQGIPQDPENYLINS